jgi:hypothetical protein
MASRPVFTVGDGIIKIPEELKDDPRLKYGAKLRLVSSGKSMVVLESDTSESESAVDSLQRVADWRNLRGIFAGSSFDPNAELELERQREESGTR